VLNMLLYYIKIESDNPNKFKLVLQKFLYENSFYFFNMLNFKTVKVIWIGLVFENVALEVDMHVHSFFLYLLIFILDLFVYIA
jgi:hypothetical protein